MSQLHFVSFEPHKNKKELKKFIQLAWDLNASDPAWVPPLRLQVLDNLDVKKNPFYKHAKIQLWNAYKGKKLVGRIAAISDARHNEFHGEKTGFWGFFECVNDQAVANELFAKAEEWLKQNGHTTAQGPANPSLNHEAGMLINNFERSPYIMMTHNPSYYTTLVEGAGYGKIKDLLAFEMQTPEKFDDRVGKIAELVKTRGRIVFRPINMKKFKEEIQTIKTIYNSAWEKNWGFVPMDDEEFAHTAKGMKDILWPEYCLIAEADGKPIGFSLALPDVNQIFKNIPNGKLLPFGIVKLLTGVKPAGKKINRVRVITLGVKKEWRASGVASVFYYETYKQAIKDKLWGGECSWILEDNRDMLSAIETFSGTKAYKTYRIYQKSV